MIENIFLINYVFRSIIMTAEDVRNAIKDLNDLDDFVRLEAENTIAMNMPDEIDVLHEEVLKNYHKTIKLSMIEILSSLKNPASIDVFIELLNDENKWVRRESSSALTKYGDEAVDKLIEATKVDNWRARGGAVWALSKIANPKSLDVLIEASKDEKSFVRSGSVIGLGEIGGPEAKKALEDLLEVETTAYTITSAKAALEKIEANN